MMGIEWNEERFDWKLWKSYILFFLSFFTIHDELGIENRIDENEEYKAQAKGKGCQMAASRNLGIRIWRCFLNSGRLVILVINAHQQRQRGCQRLCPHHVADAGEVSSLI